MARKYVRTKIFNPNTRFVNWDTELDITMTFDKMFLTGDDWSPITSFTINTTNHLATIVCPDHRLNRLEVIEVRNAIELEANSQYRVESIIDSNTFTIAYNESSHSEITGTNLELHLPSAGWSGVSGNYENSRGLNVVLYSATYSNFDVFYNGQLISGRIAASGAAYNQLNLSSNVFYIDDVGFYSNVIQIDNNGTNSIGNMSCANMDYGNYCIMSYHDGVQYPESSVNVSAVSNYGSGALNFSAVNNVYRNVMIPYSNIQNTNATYLVHPILAEGNFFNSVFAFESNILISILGNMSDNEIYVNDEHFVRVATINQSKTAPAYIKISDWYHHENLL